MPKQKTRKAVAKRFKITAKKKVMRRKSNQNHFNAKEAPKMKGLKRTDEVVKGKNAKNILKELN